MVSDTAPIPTILIVEEHQLPGWYNPGKKLLTSSDDHPEQMIKTPRISHTCFIAYKLLFKMAATPFEQNLVLSKCHYWKPIETCFWWLYLCFQGQGTQ